MGCSLSGRSEMGFVAKRKLTRVTNGAARNLCHLILFHRIFEIDIWPC
jgi:hypothetical protein